MGHRARMAAPGDRDVVNAEEWRAVKSVLRQAMDIPVAHRPALIDAACAGRPEMQREVESLLAAHERESAVGDPLISAVRAGVRAATPTTDSAPQDHLRTVLGAALGSHFDILGLLGSGGMGAVYLAQERALDRTVAIKVMRPDRATSPGSGERFRREARIAAQLSHPGIVPLHSFGEVDGLWYFVMGYVRGQSLAERLLLEGRLPPDEARRILLEIVDALEHAHQHDVIHLDIKPANILLDEETGRPRLADFGISRVEGAVDSGRNTGEFMGTPLYMSPEQAEPDEEVDVRSDIYSVGAVAYAMLAGRAPFAGDDARHVLSRRRVEDPVPILEIVPRLPADLASVVMRCLARDREARWRDAAALRAALRSSGHVRLADLPQAVADLPGFAAYALAWVMFWTFRAAESARAPTSRSLLILLAILVPVGLSLHVWRLRSYGMRLRQLLRIVSWPPKWWGMWWPASLRDRDDLWPLLPPIARATRIALSLLIVVLAVVATVPDARDVALVFAGNTAAVLLIGGTAVLTLVALTWTMRHGLDFEQTMQFLFSATAPSPFWQERRVARLLRKAGQLVTRPDPNLASDHARAIEELTRRFPRVLGTVGATAVRAMQQQVAVIARVERDGDLRARDVSRAEVDRLTRRLSLLRAGDAAAPEYRELGDSLRQQLALIRLMQGRRTLALARRARLFDVLRALWSQVGLLVDAERDGPDAVREAEQRVLAICSRILDARADASPDQ
jgi:hypothetical protein